MKTVKQTCEECGQLCEDEDDLKSVLEIGLCVSCGWLNFK